MNKKTLIELLTIFLITLIYNLVFSYVTNDEIWNYGFSYNIANGLIPYKDFNMVITPLYPFLASIFLTLFGKNIVIFHIFSAITSTILFYLIKKLVPRGYYIIYAFLLFHSLPNYSLFCLLLLYILMYMEEKKSNDYLIGIVLGLTFLTKQHIGIMLCIPTLFTKDIKKIIKGIIGFLIPNIIFLIYLLISKTLYEFIDYAFLGITSFAEENLLISIWMSLTIISIIYLIYQYIKTKDIKILYILFFQIMAYPLFDTYHVTLAFLPVLGYFLSKLKLVVKIIRITFLIFIIILFSTKINIYLKYEHNYPNSTELLHYRNLSPSTEKSIKIITNYIKINKDNIFIIDPNAYLLKLESNIPLTKYDLLNDGNLGKNGHKKIIEKIDKYCKNNKCLFLMRKEEINNNTLSQTNQEIITYIANTYKEISNISIYTIYGNEYKHE